MQSKCCLLCTRRFGNMQNTCCLLCTRRFGNMQNKCCLLGTRKFGNMQSKCCLPEDVVICRLILTGQLVIEQKIITGFPVNWRSTNFLKIVKLHLINYAYRHYPCVPNTIVMRIYLCLCLLPKV